LIDVNFNKNNTKSLFLFYIYEIILLSSKERLSIDATPSHLISFITEESCRPH